MKRLKIISVMGVRPNFVKIASLYREFKKVDDKIRHLIVHTGQHYDFKMSREFFKSLNIPEPDINFEVGSGTHAAQTANIMLKFEPVCLSKKPDWVVVLGDTNSTLACAIVTKKLRISLAHIEAGLRSYDMTMPEEINRRLTDCLADILFTPSHDADMNLIREGIDKDKIKMVGNIMIDTLVAELEGVNRRRLYERWNLRPKNFIYVTLHRPSNVDNPDIFSTILNKLIIVAKNIPVIFPLHPRTLQRIKNFRLKEKMSKITRLYLIGPLSYHDSISFAKNALLVVTDSGGLQEETTYLGTPCLTLRSNTERPITITNGTNKLTSPNNLLEDIGGLMVDPKNRRTKGPPQLWDGKTAQRIVEFFINLIR